MKQGHRNEERGFTLLELVVTFTIIGILVGIGVTTYFTVIDKYRLNTDIRILNQVIQEARLRAISAGIPHGVAFERRPDHDRYFIFIDCAGGQNMIYTDADGNPDNNAPINNLTECNIVTYDPPVSDEAIFELARGNHFGLILGDNTPTDDAPLEYICFNPVGQIVQGQNLATGVSNDILIERVFNDNYTYEGGVTLSAGSGLSSTFYIRRK